jgi:hypothetical protein
LKESEQPKMPKRSKSYTRNKGGECTKVERVAHCLRVDFECPYCGCDLRKAKSTHIDHVKAQVWGGTKDPKNQVACCGSCNCSKQHKLLSEFAEERGDKEIVKRVRRATRRRLPLEQAKEFLGESPKGEKTVAKNKPAKANKPTKPQQSASDSELLDEVLEFMDTAIGSLDMVQEALEEGQETIPEIGVTPLEALDNAINNMTSKTMKIRAKRVLASEGQPPEPDS